ncbi:MAG: alpha/beta hydrolase [Ilumatobacteraceae bacterium]
MTTTNPHLTMPTVERGPAPAEADVVVVAVHGRSQSTDYLIEHLVDPIADERICWLLPAAHGAVWYPVGFMAPFADNQPQLDHSLAALDRIAAHLTAVPTTRVVWAGFSQGACLVSEWVARHPRRWGGLLAFTGGRIGPDGTDLAIDESATGLEGMPAYFGVGARDTWVPLTRVEQTAAVYRAAGADVVLDVFDDALHEIRPGELDHARRVLHAARR